MPVTLSFLEKSWLPSWLSWLSGSPLHRGPFAATALILPSTLGEIRAVFSGTIMEKETRHQTRGPFLSHRVKTTIGGFPPRIKRGRRTDIWTASPSDGWKIDLATKKIDFILHFDACWSRRSEASWVEATEHILRVKAYISAENLPGKTCKATTNISFMEWRQRRVRKEIVTPFKKLSADETIELKMPSGDYKGVRLAHIEIRSPIFREGKKIYRVSQRTPNFSADYDRVKQSVYFTAKYLR